jgi:CRP-like cAMP-binding protein
VPIKSVSTERRGFWSKLLLSALTPPRNRLLRRLPANDFAYLQSSLTPIELKAHSVLHHRRLPFSTLYFIETGLVSVSAKIDSDKWVEVWLIGSEGMAGLPVALGRRRARHRRLVQVGGSALAMTADEFQDALNHIQSLRSIMNDYMYLVLLQTSQSGACNAHHSVRQRLARWLCLACDSLQSFTLPLTHDVLAGLLGIRRASVSECLELFESERIVENSRGLIHLTDPKGMERNCCDCYRFISREYRRLFPAEY